jgi:hypothetical protein
MSKECQKCHKKLKISGNFYTHRDLKESQCSDLWCTSCVKKFIKDKITLQEYCEINYREFSEDLWEWVNKYTLDKLEQDEKYKNLNTIEKQDMLTKRILNEYFKSMGKTQYYRIKKEINNNSLAISNSESNQNIPNDEKIYSKKWRGMYIQDDIDYLEKYYQDLQNDYTIVTRNHHDYAMKVAQASLHTDKCYEEMLNGIVGADKKWKEAREIFDALCQSAKFSEKTRTPNDISGLGSFGELVKRIEEDGFVQSKVIFERDSIDILLEEFRHTFKALRGVSDGE